MCVCVCGVCVPNTVKVAGSDSISIHIMSHNEQYMEVLVCKPATHAHAHSSSLASFPLYTTLCAHSLFVVETRRAGDKANTIGLV